MREVPMKRLSAVLIAVLGLTLVAISATGSSTAATGSASATVGVQEGDSPVLLVAQINITDRDEYRRYEAGFGEIFRKYGGESAGFSESPEVLEGEWDYTRTVVIRFASSEAAKAWYYSPEYQELAKHRWAASKANLVMIDGR